MCIRGRDGHTVESMGQSAARHVDGPEGAEEIDRVAQLVATAVEAKQFARVVWYACAFLFAGAAAITAAAFGLVDCADAIMPERARFYNACVAAPCMQNATSTCNARWTSAVEVFEKRPGACYIDTTGLAEFRETATLYLDAGTSACSSQLNVLLVGLVFATFGAFIFLMFTAIFGAQWVLY